MADDHDLLRRYGTRAPDAQAAFTALVAEHLDLVYSVALRVVRSSSLAEDVAQSVFLDLARQASRLPSNIPLVAWLHVVTRRAAIDAVRDDARRRAREQAAVALADMKSSSPSPDWHAVEPFLDEAVESLPPPDRTAILLRFFENKSLREVGAALGTSDDAAQKRVTRALDQLRTFFLRRGIAVSAAGLATDLCAHALHSAPIGLGATIATAAAAVPHAALSAAMTLAMTTTQKLGVAAALVAAVVTVYEANVIFRQQSGIDRSQAQATALSTELAALRATRKTTADQLALAQKQLAARLAQATPPTPAPGDAALEAQMKTWLAQLDRIKTFIADQPGMSIPELQFLSEQDWFAIAARGELKSTEDFRRAAAALRDRAESRFTGKIAAALYVYTRAHHDHLPATPQQLAPYFDPPVDPTLLDRYEMLHQGKVSEVPQRERMRIVTAKAPADVEYDIYHWAGIDGYGNNGSIMGYNLSEAHRAFRRANPGQTASGAAQLLPYLKWPVDVVVLQNYIDRQKIGGDL